MEKTPNQLTKKTRATRNHFVELFFEFNYRIIGEILLTQPFLQLLFWRLPSHYLLEERGTKNWPN